MSSNAPLFTCLSCSIAFHVAEDQRAHYRSDHHRYNMKRRVASLPPVSLEVFNQKVLDRRLETSIMSSPKGSHCDVCNKTYTTENAYRSHIQSKKHKEMELKPRPAPTPRPDAATPTAESPAPAPVSPTLETIEEPKSVSLVVSDDASDSEINQTIDEKIAAARARLSPNSCLFCPQEAPTLDENLEHMSAVHSFFVPDAEYLVDLTGLIAYLGEKIAVGNVCIFCNGKGKEFRTLEATRKHMLDKSHCKIAYDSEDDRLEVSDYYDFSSSYPAEDDGKSSTEQGEWEDVEDGSDDDESADEEVAEDSESEDDLPDSGITYGENEMQLVLPSGIRIGHRKLRYQPQAYHGSRRGKTEDPESGAALVRRLLADKNSALVPRKGGFGAFGSGTEVVKARNRGEAREAGRHVREFRDQKRRENFKTRIAFINNNQKHFRDPLLQ
uniref:Zinc finger protein 622-like protein n=1 Tax=Mycena chlorophos TaxID=658473 RepID=A0ABQ0M4F1_MYCCL|nr:zinc finger protein 622-like protein [Mycena chlorophos]